jgi:hypothetical protein
VGSWKLEWGRLAADCVNHHRSIRSLVAEWQEDRVRNMIPIDAREEFWRMPAVRILADIRARQSQCCSVLALQVSPTQLLSTRRNHI